MGSDLRITGMATGMNFEETIAKITKYSRAPVDRLKQEQQKLIWKQEAFRSQNSVITQLRDFTFDMKLESTYGTKKTSSTNAQVATATATVIAPQGNYALNVTRLASVATNSSSQALSVRSQVVGNYVDSNVQLDAKNSKFTLALDGVNHTLTLPASAYDIYKYNPGTGEKSLNDLAEVIQTQLDGAGLATPVCVKATTEHELVFYAGQNASGNAHTLVLKNAVLENGTAASGGADTIRLEAGASSENDFYNGMTLNLTDGMGQGQSRKVIAYDGVTKTATLESAWSSMPDATSEYEVVNEDFLGKFGFENRASSKEILGSILESNEILVNAMSNKFKITVGSETTREVTIDQGTYTRESFAAQVQTKLTALGGDYAKLQVSVSNYNQLRITPYNESGTPASVKLETGSSNDLLWKMGFTSGKESDYPKNNLIPANSLISQKDRFINQDFFAGRTATTNSSFSLAINGQSFTFNVNQKLEEIFTSINNNQTAGVYAYYDTFNDKMVLTNTKTGDQNASGAEIKLTDPDGFLSNLMKISQSNEVSGQNAQFSLNGVTTEQTENTFTMNEITFTLVGTGLTNLSVTSDTSAVSGKVEEFVNKYNALLESVNTDLTESRSMSDKYTYYQPLTDEQKKAMSAEEIKTWDEKAKQGILHNDPILRATMVEMRLSLSKVVETPLSMKGTALSGTLDLTGNNHLQVTVAGQTRELIMDERSYNSSQYDVLADDLQKKINLAFGTNAVQVAVSSDHQLQLTSQNIAFSLSNGTESTGLNLLGFSTGASVTATYDRLDQLGIKTGDWSENGKLYFDKTKFEAALQSNPEGVRRLLTNFESYPSESGDTDYRLATKAQQEENSKGIFYKLHETLSAQVKKMVEQAGLGGTVSYTNVFGKELIRNSERIDLLEERLSTQEERLWKMFNSMDNMVNNMNSKSSWLSGIVSQMSSGG